MISLAVLALMLQTLRPSDPAVTIYSYLEGRRWQFAVSRTDLEQAPRWRSTDDHPPLAPGAAVRSAEELFSKLFPALHKDQWRVRVVTLQQWLFPETWVYLVSFVGPGPCADVVPSPGEPGCGSAGPDPEMRMVVLLNGHAVVPTSSIWTPTIQNRN